MKMLLDDPILQRTQARLKAQHRTAIVSHGETHVAELAVGNDLERGVALCFGGVEGHLAGV
jgi:hypothetical protein